MRIVALFGRHCPHRLRVCTLGTSGGGWLPRMDGWVRLGHKVMAERSRRWRTRADFAAATGLSTRLLDDLETGARTNYSQSTLAAIEGALGWEYGTCERVVAGGKVRRTSDPALAELLELWPVLSGDARVMLVELARRAVESRGG